MLENIQALRVFHKHGSMQKAALELRLSQSAVSKRLAKLQDQLGFPIFVKAGRYVHLTPGALEFLLKVQNLSSELATIIEDFKSTTVQPERFDLRLGISESLLASFAATWVVSTCHDLGINLQPSAHRGSLIVEKVQSGELHLGLCAGALKNNMGLVHEVLGREPMCFVGDVETLRKPWSEMSFLGIEEHSMSWNDLKRDVQELGLKAKIELGSYSSLLHLSLAGMGAALVPVSLADAYRVAEKNRRKTKKNIMRTIGLVYRKSALSHSGIMKFRESLLKSRPSHIVT